MPSFVFLAVFSVFLLGGVVVESSCFHDEVFVSLHKRQSSARPRFILSPRHENAKRQAAACVGRAVYFFFVMCVFGICTYLCTCVYAVHVFIWSRFNFFLWKEKTSTSLPRKGTSPVRQTWYFVYNSSVKPRFPSAWYRDGWAAFQKAARRARKRSERASFLIFV